MLGSEDILVGPHNLKGLFEVWDVVLNLGLVLDYSLGSGISCYLRVRVKGW